MVKWSLPWPRAAFSQPGPFEMKRFSLRGRLPVDAPQPAAPGGTPSRPQGSSGPATEKEEEILPAKPPGEPERPQGSIGSALSAVEKADAAAAQFKKESEELAAEEAGGRPKEDGDAAAEPVGVDAVASATADPKIPTVTGSLRPQAVSSDILEQPSKFTESSSGHVDTYFAASSDKLAQAVKGHSYKT